MKTGVGQSDTNQPQQLHSPLSLDPWPSIDLQGLPSPLATQVPWPKPGTPGLPAEVTPQLVLLWLFTGKQRDVCPPKQRGPQDPLTPLAQPEKSAPKRHFQQETLLQMRESPRERAVLCANPNPKACAHHSSSYPEVPKPLPASSGWRGRLRGLTGLGLWGLPDPLDFAHLCTGYSDIRGRPPY